MCYGELRASFKKKVWHHDGTSASAEIEAPRSTLAGSSLSTIYKHIMPRKRFDLMRNAVALVLGPSSRPS
jgi:hypothetical protein